MSNIQVIYDSFDISEIVRSVEWRGAIDDCFRVLTVDLLNVDYAKKQKLIDFKHGKELRLFHNKKELFRGVLFSFDLSDDGNMSLTAFDDNVYLTKSRDTRKFINQKASDIVRRLCNDFEIPIGTISDTGYVIPKLIFRDKSLYDMIMTAITVTEKQTGRRFFIGNELGELTLRERKEQVSQWVIESGSNLTSASYSQSIEEMKTKIKVTKNGKVLAEINDRELMEQYGIMQHIEEAKEGTSTSAAKELAKSLLDQLGTIDDEAIINAIGIDEVIAGTSVYVREEITGIVGGYYVIADSHRFENGKHTMRLTLSATDDLPTMEYEPPMEDSPTPIPTSQPKYNAPQQNSESDTEELTFAEQKLKRILSDFYS